MKDEQKDDSALQKTSTLNKSDYLRHRICLQTVGKSGKDDTYKTEIQRDTARGSNPSLSAKEKPKSLIYQWFWLF